MILNLNHFLLVLSIGLALQSCKPSSPKKSVIQKNQVEKVPEVRPVVAETISAGKLYEFFMTVDPQYCSADSIVEGDCNSGYLYFTDKGNVVFLYLCVNDVSLDYSIGRVTYQDKQTICAFDKSYSVPFPEDDLYNDNPLSDQQLNNSRLKQEERNVIELKQLSCRKGAYAFDITIAESNVLDHYLVLPADPDAKSYFIQDFARIKALQQF